MDSKTFAFKCPACHASLSIPMEHAGKKGQCNKCGSAIIPRAQRRLWRPLLVLSGIGALVAIFTVRFPSLAPGNEIQIAPEGEAGQAAAIEADLPAPPLYEILNTEVEDSPDYATVHRYILITGGSITRESLTALLVHECSIISQIRGPQYHELPEKLGIRIYSTREHWESKNQRSIAWYFRDAHGKVSAEIDDVLIAEYHATPTTKFGLTEEQRKAIWNDGCYGERAATNAAEQAFPWPSWGESEQAKWKEFFEQTRPQQSEMKDRFRRENDQIVMNYYSIDKATYDAITIEGLERGWPLPPE